MTDQENTFHFESKPRHNGVFHFEGESPDKTRCGRTTRKMFTAKPANERERTHQTCPRCRAK